MGVSYITCEGHRRVCESELHLPARLPLGEQHLRAEGATQVLDELEARRAAAPEHVVARDARGRRQAVVCAAELHLEGLLMLANGRRARLVAKAEGEGAARRPERCALYERCPVDILHRGRTCEARAAAIPIEAQTRQLHVSYMAVTWQLHGSYMAVTWQLHTCLLAHLVGGAGAGVGVLPEAMERDVE